MVKINDIIEMLISEIMNKCLKIIIQNMDFINMGISRNNT